MTNDMENEHYPILEENTYIAPPVIFFMFFTLPLFFIIKGSKFARIWITSIYMTIFIGALLMKFKSEKTINWLEMLSAHQLAILIALSLLYPPQSNRWFKSIPSKTNI